MDFTDEQIREAFGDKLEGPGVSDQEMLEALRLYGRMTADQRGQLANSVGCKFCYQNKARCQCWNDE